MLKTKQKLFILSETRKLFKIKMISDTLDFQLIVIGKTNIRRQYKTNCINER